MGLLQSVLCDIDFNDSESYRGTSYLPFLGFMVFFAGMMIAFIGIVKISNSRHQWNIFYDERDRKDLKSPAVNKDRKTGIIMLVVGIVMMIVSFLIRYKNIALARGDEKREELFIHLNNWDYEKNLY